jgi:hypothetical protein
MRDAGCLWDEWLIDLLMAATRRRRCDDANRDTDDDDVDGDDLAPVQRVALVAGTVPPPTTTAARSVFELAQGAESGPVRVHRHNFPGSPSGFATSASAPPRRAVNTVARAGAVVRVSGLAYPCGRWTEAKAEAERVRRAKQRPPRPSAAAREFRISKGAAQTVPGPLVVQPVPPAGAAVRA